jgi:hypothetical protein
VIAVVTGYIGTFPLAGMTLHYLQYLLGLERLGWTVSYLEDTGRWTYDPGWGTYTGESERNARYLSEVMEEHGFGSSWSFRSHDGRYYGLSEPDVSALCSRADLFLNLSGSCWLRPAYRAPGRPTLYVDTDPGYTQIKVARVARGEGTEDEKYSVERMAEHSHHFTFGENIGRSGCGIPTDLFEWQPTRQPIVLDLWPTPRPPMRDVFTTILSWEPYPRGLEFGGRTYLGKAPNFHKIMHIPRDGVAKFELALSGEAPRGKLGDLGWRLVDAHAVSESPASYQKYICQSYGEFSVAKDIYVDMRTGWFSERSACYLACGRPVVLQDTAFSDLMPTGRGLMAFQSAHEAAAAILSIQADYEDHSRAARDLAATHFDASSVLRAVLSTAGI